MLDWKNGTTDNGLYLKDGRLRLYPYGTEGQAPIGANTYVQVVLTRDGTTKRVMGYVDGLPQIDFTDTGDHGVISAANVLRWFKDDGGDESAGAAARLRVYDVALSPAQVWALDRLPAPGSSLPDDASTLASGPERAHDVTQVGAPAAPSMPTGRSAATVASADGATGVAAVRPLRALTTRPVVQTNALLRLPSVENDSCPPGAGPSAFPTAPPTDVEDVPDNTGATTRARLLSVGMESAGVDGPGALAPDGVPEAQNAPCNTPDTWYFLKGGPFAGDPVDLSAGLFSHTHTDLALPDVMPLVFERTYRPNDPRGTRALGCSTMHNYGLFLWRTDDMIDLILPDFSRIRFLRVLGTPGGQAGAWEHTGTRSDWYGSRLVWTGSGWDVTLVSGTVYAFGKQGGLMGVRDRYGNRISVTKANSLPNTPITRLRSPNGRWIAFTSDGSERITQARDNLGRMVSCSYAVNDRLIDVTDVLGGNTHHTYDAQGRMLTIRDQRGNTYLTNEYDATGRIQRQIQGNGGIYQFAYEPVPPCTVLPSMERPTGTARLLTAAESPLAQLPPCNFSPPGTPRIAAVNVTDPRGSVRRVMLGNSGQAVSETVGYGTPDAQTTTTVNLASGLASSRTDSLGRTTAYTYNTKGQVLSVTRMAGTSEAVTTAYAYEPTFGRVATVTDALNRTSTHTYDTLGSLVSVTDALGQQTTYTYNAAGMMRTVTGPLGRTVTYTYEAGDYVARTNPLGQTRRVFVDAAGRSLVSIDQLGRRGVAEYDAANRLRKATDGLGGVTELNYDANHNLTSLRDARNNVTAYEYDGMDQLTRRVDPLLRQNLLAYDLGGNLTQVTSRKGQVTTYCYDGLGRPTLTGFGTVGAGCAAAYESTLTCSYDLPNRRTTVTDSQAGAIVHQYDNLGRLISETTPQGTVSYTYDAIGRRTSMSVPGQTAVTYSYDNGSRLTGITQGTSSVGFAYDAANHRTSLTLPGGITATSSYDTADRLTGLTYALGATTLGTLGYSYDASGQRTSDTGTWARIALPQTLSSASYNANNQLTSWAGTPLSYDLSGNLTSDGATTYTWNARGQLTGMAGATTASFAYDALGRRRQATRSGTATDFVYEGGNAAQERMGGTTTANLLTGGLDAHYTRSEGGAASTLLTDAQGSTLALVDSAGAVQTSYTYEPFGRTTTSGTASTNPYQYTGRENDGTGLYYYRARYYHPTYQRFISEDPLGYATGDTNVYAYVGNGAPNYVDPLGLSKGGAGGSGGGGGGPGGVVVRAAEAVPSGAAAVVPVGRAALADRVGQVGPLAAPVVAVARMVVVRVVGREGQVDRVGRMVGPVGRADQEVHGVGLVGLAKGLASIKGSTMVSSSS